MAITNKLNSTKENLEKQSILTQGGYIGVTYTAQYIDAIFTIWYSAGKPSIARLIKMIPDPADFGIAATYPSEETVGVWAKDFKERAISLDEEVSRQLGDRLIAEKVKMLDSHATIASEMQDMALTFLRDNKDKLNSNSAVRLLVEGVRIERESRGIPRTLEKLSEKSDEDLWKQIEDLLLRSPATNVPIDDSE